jgi:hypothetical protein
MFSAANLDELAENLSYVPAVNTIKLLDSSRPCLLFHAVKIIPTSDF